LLQNELYLEAQFVQNVMEGAASITWHRTAQYEGAFTQGRIDGEGVAYTAFDRSYRFVGVCRSGRPAVEAEAAYVYSQLDRSAVTKSAETLASGKSAKPVKGKATEVASDRLAVLAGSELGKLVVRAGTQVSLDEEVRRCDAAADAAETALLTAKSVKGKGPVVPAAPVGPSLYPEPAGTHAVPSEARRVVVVRVLPVVPVDPTADPASAAVLGSTVGGLQDGETVGAPVTFWLKARSQNQCAVESGRWALTSVAFVDGQRVATPRAVIYPPLTADAIDTVAGAAGVGVGVESGTKSPKSPKSPGRAAKTSAKGVSFAAEGEAAGAWPRVNFAVGASVGDLTKPPVAPASVPVPVPVSIGEGVLTALTAHSMGGVPAYLLSAGSGAAPDVSLQVPFKAVSSPETGLTVFVDLVLPARRRLDRLDGLEDRAARAVAAALGRGERSGVGLAVCEGGH
jgi:hypothetical protein